MEMQLNWDRIYWYLIRHIWINWDESNTEDIHLIQLNVIRIPSANIVFPYQKLIKHSLILIPLNLSNRLIVYPTNNSKRNFHPSMS